MRLLLKEVLRSVIMTELDKRVSCSQTVKVWRDSLVKPVIIMMAFSREVTGCCKLLLQKKCFHVAGCHNYAHYIQFDVHHMK